MSKQKRQEEIVDFCIGLRKIWKKNPELRFGQLIGNINADLYYVKDKQLMKDLGGFYENKNKISDVVSQGVRQGRKEDSKDS
jgi:hypothetical protein